MLTFLIQLWAIPTAREKRGIIGLIFMMVISAGLEIIGIGLIVPIIGVIARPELAEQNAIIQRLQQYLAPQASTNTFILHLCGLIILLFIGKNLFLIAQVYLQTRFVFKMGARLGTQLYDKYIHAPYPFHLERNSGHLMGALTLSSSIPSGVFMPFMMLAAEAIVIAFVLVTLLSLSPVITLCLAGLTSVIAVLLYYPTHHFNYRLGTEMHREQLEVTKYALQGLKAVKESKIRNVEPFFTAEYGKHIDAYNRVQSLRTFLTNIPRFAIEAMLISLGIGALAVLLLLDMAHGSIILTLSLLAASMIRLMPSFSRIQYSLTSLRQNQHVLERFQEEAIDLPAEDKRAKRPDLPFEAGIALDRLSFRYGSNQADVFTNFSLDIPKNSSVAFVGPTGCGKTTLVDVILGLLKPTTGQVLIDSVDIEENLPAWQTRIGYVPQFIFLLDDTVKANVAFGVPDNQIDDARIRECLRTAQILDFIEDLPQGIHNLIGENGIRLSGGQRQRIGIARALYHNPEVLVLDEATSALDDGTERAFVDALKNLHGKLTILIVAHRLTTVENCDRIINMATNKPSCGCSQISAN